jgi:membrane-bound metal-dependent hydrolase YbcI (DUF457 family)
MFIGHFGIGFGAKRFVPVSLGFLFIAAQFSDLLWPALLQTGIEHVKILPGITRVTPLDFSDYPISHSLAMAIVWGVVLGLFCQVFLKNIKYSVVIFICVISHWFLDFIVHRPDLPIFPGGSARFGLGLWNYPYLAALIEGMIFIGGVILYYMTTTAKNRFGTFGLIGLIVFLLLIQAGNMIGPPPPTVNAIAWSGQLQWLIVIFAFFIDKNRVLRDQKVVKTE